jgi:hypothetical protein
VQDRARNKRIRRVFCCIDKEKPLTPSLPLRLGFLLVLNNRPYVLYVV